MAKILGIDYGRKRIGLAISDENKRISFPFKTLETKNPRASIPDLKAIASEEGVTAVVVGLPLDQHGNVGPIAKEIERWIESLQKALGITINTRDERFSSQWADRIDHDDNRDTLAAQAILDDYLRTIESNS